MRFWNKRMDDSFFQRLGATKYRFKYPGQWYMSSVGGEGYFRFDPTPAEGSPPGTCDVLLHGGLDEDPGIPVLRNAAVADVVAFFRLLQKVNSDFIDPENCCRRCPHLYSCEFAFDSYNVGCEPMIDCLASK